MDRWAAGLAEVLEVLRQTAIGYLPRVATALLLLLSGWLAARLMRALTRRLVRRLDRWIPGRIEQELRSSALDEAAPRVVGALVFWLVFLLFIAAAGQVLGLPVVTGGLRQLAQYLPSLLAATLVLAAALVFGNLARAATVSAASSARLLHAEFLGQMARIAIWVVAVVIALQQIGIDSTMLMLVLGIALGGVIGGAAIAFGLGAKVAAGNLIAAHDLIQRYRVGQRVDVAGQRGRIISFTSNAVLLETTEGRSYIPARLFAEQPTVLLDDTGEPEVGR